MYQELSVEKKRLILLWTFGLSLFWVIFLWNFWVRGVYALGFNATFFLAGMIALFFYVTGEKASSEQNLAWLVPLVFMALSFSIYENPFLKAVNLLALPLSMAVFASYTLLPKEKYWKPRYIFRLMAERLRFFKKIKQTLLLIGDWLPLPRRRDQQMATRVFMGLGIFLLLAFFIIIPLLSSADPMFAQQLRKINEWFFQIISFRYLNRVVFFLIFGVLLASIYLSLQRRLAASHESGQAQVHETEKPKFLYPVIAGIVLAGVLLLYILFLYTQVKYLWVAVLPIEFREAEHLVKSGFWQLLFLSLLNIGFFLVYFRRTNNLVQQILKVFTLASFLLLSSAGQRMFKYVFNYGLSYEKFFASYTVLFCAIVFIWLFTKLIQNKPADTLRFIIFLLLWMYGVLTMLPVERMVFSANVALARRPQTRIDLAELKMLSYDVAPLVVAYRSDDVWQNSWNYWYYKNSKIVRQKHWYEKNIGNLVGVPNSSQRKKYELFDPSQPYIPNIKIQPLR